GHVRRVRRVDIVQPRRYARRKYRLYNGVCFVAINQRHLTTGGIGLVVIGLKIDSQPVGRLEPQAPTNEAFLLIAKHSAVSAVELKGVALRVKTCHAQTQPPPVKRRVDHALKTAIVITAVTCFGSDLKILQVRSV